jgi:LCP family protein required for cell wall assembly
VVQLGRSSSENTDTIMIMRIDPATQRAAILSIPRDFSAKFALGAGHHFTGKINGAAYYGDDVLINTIKDALGIPINHYVKVDFKGFERLVNTIGGVPMYFPTPARDVHSQLYVPSAGCITLSGAQALAYARSRYYQYQGSNGGWIADNTYDYGRIHRQQDFIRRTLKQAIAKGARNPTTMLKMINDVLPALTFDQTFNTADKVYSFAQQLKNLEPDHITTYTIETKHKDGTEDNLEYVDSANNRLVLQYFTNGQVVVAPGSGTDPAAAGGGPSVPTTTRVFGPDPATASSQSTDTPTAATTCGQ